MKFFIKIIASILGNALGLFIANRFIPGFELQGDWYRLLLLAFILALLNLIIRPILKLMLGPIILLTFGIGIVIVNALVLFILDTLSKNITIQGIPTLIYGTLIIGITNIIVHLIVKSK